MTSRTLPLLDGNGNFVEDYRLVLVAAMHYPKCAQSIEHFRRIVGCDEESTPGKRSQINKVIHTDTNRRKRQGHIVGHIFRSLIEGLAEEEPISLNKAYYLAKRYAESSTVEGKKFKPSSTRSIRDAFGNFVNVGHFWCAQVIFPELFIASAKDREAFCKFIAAASDIQSDIKSLEVLVDWHPWVVPGELLPVGRALKVPPISKEKRRWLAEYNSEIGR